MTEKNWCGLTQLPSGQFADYVWGGLSETMRNALRGLTERGETYLLQVNRRTLVAMENRRLMTADAQLTEDGKALIEWMKDNERNT